LVAGISENLLFWEKNQSGLTQGGGQSDGSGCTCKDNGCGQEEQLVAGKGRLEQVINGLRFAATDIWGDIAGWFFLGVVLAGLITVLIPEAFIHQYLGGGIKSMLLMLVIGVPLYICATASTPIAAAFILKGVSPGTALVFLLVGPATNITSLTVLARILGKRATGFYLATVSLVSLGCGMTVDHIYRLAGINPIAVVGKAGDVRADIGRRVAVDHLLAFRHLRFRKAEIGERCIEVHRQEIVFPCDREIPAPMHVRFAGMAVVVIIGRFEFGNRLGRGGPVGVDRIDGLGKLGFLCR
jgi:hypothetical protein